MKHQKELLTLRALCVYSLVLELRTLLCWLLPFIYSSVSAPFAKCNLSLLKVRLSVTNTRFEGHLVHKTPYPECNLHGMTTWAPIHAPNLWAIRPRSALSYSRPMHADHPWNVTITSHLFSSGSLIVAHPTSFTPHAWAPGDLCLSLTDNWSVAWKPPF